MIAKGALHSGYNFGDKTLKVLAVIAPKHIAKKATDLVDDGGIYTYDFREARKKEIVKEYSQIAYVLMDTSKKNKYAFSKVFELNECVLITEIS